VSVRVQLPGPLRVFVGGQAELHVDGVRSVRDLLHALPEGVRERVLDERGNVRPHVNVFVGASNIRDTGKLDTALQDGNEVSIIPAVSGGGSALRRPRRSRERGMALC
jgi:molybdopterin synthase sulfur carrier subunit